MRQQDNTQATAKRHKNHRTSKHIDTQGQTPQRPASDDKEGWKAYWKQQGQPWRIMPEIDAERQDYLANQRLIPPNIEQGIYPFKHVEPKLTRSDIEWLLATHESGGIRGPVDLSDQRQQEREGLDLRGAHLEEEDLNGLPLARVHGGLTHIESFRSTKEQREMAAIHLQKAKLLGAYLHGAYLRAADLQDALLAEANLQGAYLRAANLQDADLEGADLQDAQLRAANLQSSNLTRANLQDAILIGVNLQSSNLTRANLQDAVLWRANLQDANLARVQLKGADFKGVTLGNERQVGPQLVDIDWGGVNLSVLDWSSIRMIGDEYKTRRVVDERGEEKKMSVLIEEYQIAIRANRQLAVVLRDQGINEDADWFAYRAQILKRRLLWKQLHLPIILRGKEPLGWKEQVQKVLVGEKKVTGGTLLSRIPRRLSILSLLVLSLPLLIILPLFLAIGMLLFGILRLLARKVPKLKKLTPDWLWLKKLLVFFKQLLFASLAILIYSGCAYLVWEKFNPFVNSWLQILFYSFVTFIIGSSCLLLVAGIQYWWLKRKMGQRTTLIEGIFPHSPGEAENIYELNFGWFFEWVTIIYDDLVSYGQYLFSLLLGLLTGYGYKPGRTLFWYVLTVIVFAWVYYQIWAANHLEHVTGHTLSYVGAVIFSITAFHGRGFFLVLQ